jgi:hypothetical protein
MLHLHRFKRQQALPFGNLFATRNFDGGHLPRHRRFDLAVMDAMRRARAAGRQAEFERLAFVEDDDTLLVGKA